MREHQPTEYFDGGERVGSVGGEASDDLFTNITLLSNQDGVNYDFCEHVGASLSGHVYHDMNDDGVFDVNEDGIGNVGLKLLRRGRPGHRTPRRD